MQHKVFSSSLVLLLITGVSVPAFAQFTVSLGVQSVELDVNTKTEFNPSSEDNLDGNATTTDINVGGELALGYQFDFEHGQNIALEAFGQLLAPQTKVAPVTGASFAVLENQANASFDWIAGLRVRPGYDVTPAIRVFLDGGIVLGGFEVEYEDDFITNNKLSMDAESSDTLFGWRYGVGAEYKFTEKFLIGVDYTITQFDELNDDQLEDATPTGNFFKAPVYTTYTPTLRTLGLNFKYLFGTKKQHVHHHQMIDK